MTAAAIAVLAIGLIGHLAPTAPGQVSIHPQAVPGLSAMATPFVVGFDPDQHHNGGGGGSSGGATCKTTLPSANGVSYSPAELRGAYSFSTSSSATGTGETIAIIDAYGSPTISSDLACFDKTFNLPSASLKVVAPFGSVRGSNSGWALETSLDVEWAHAMAPGAALLLIETPSASLGYLINDAVPYAVNAGAQIVSMSWGAAESQLGCTTELQEAKVFSSAASSGTILVGASGDRGSSDGTNAATVDYPSADPNVVGVGGTTLTVTSGGAYASEAAWNDRSGATGGGVSACFSEPSYQSGASIAVTTSSGSSTPSGRSVPDVAYDADPYTGVWVYDTTGYSGWVQVGGTSAAAPQWAAILADSVSDGDSVSASNVHSLLYGLLGGSSVHDVTSGNNGAFDTSTGYDACSGVGTPVESSVLTAL